MNQLFKITLYTLGVVAMLVFGILFARALKKDTAPLPTAPTVEEVEPSPDTPARRRHDFATLIWLGLGFVVSAAGVGLLVARDLSNYFGVETVKILYNDEGEGIKNPDYEEAELEATKGNFLEAVRLLRAYLEKRPRDQFAALRIAEIYEKDLLNPLAAALEYEEILKQKLEPERWGWAAIHLSNLYSGKLNQPDKSIALLERIVNEYGQTAAAKKARERLGLPEDAQLAGAAAQAAQATEEATRSPQLPPGFRPKSDSERLHFEEPASTQAPALKPADRNGEHSSETPAAPQLPPGFRPKK